MRSCSAGRRERAGFCDTLSPRPQRFTNLNSTGKEPRMGFLQGRRILVTGMLSNRSIAYGIAQACAREGAELAFTYQGEGVRDRVAALAKEFGSDLVFACDVADDAQVAALFEGLAARWDRLDGLVHAIAFAPREALKGDFHESVTREA